MKQQDVNKTFVLKASEVDQKWYLINAEGQNLGRLATKVADILRGKNKATFTPNVDGGDYVVVINAEKVSVTGRKATDKSYTSHSGYPGGFKRRNFADVISSHPERVILHAVKGMLPKNKLGYSILAKLKVYAGPEHPHTAQKPIEITL